MPKRSGPSPTDSVDIDLEDPARARARTRNGWGRLVSEEAEKGAGAQDPFEQSGTDREYFRTWFMHGRLS